MPTSSAAVRIEPLAGHHVREAFTCGVPELDDYLRQRAGQDLRSNVAACYVLAESADERTVRGYYTLSSYAIDVGDLPVAMSRRLPRYPRVPAALLGRLAVDRAFQKRGFGELLLVDAMRRTLEIAARIGLHALVVDAKDVGAAAFYLGYGFIPFPSEGLRLFMPVRTIEKALAAMPG